MATQLVQVRLPKETLVELKYLERVNKSPNRTQNIIRCIHLVYRLKKLTRMGHRLVLADELGEITELLIVD